MSERIRSNLDLGKYTDVLLHAKKTLGFVSHGQRCNRGYGLSPTWLHGQQAINFQVDKANQRLEMVVNSSRILTLDTDVPRVLVANPDVVKVVPLSPNQVQISAVRAGVTQINGVVRGENAFAELVEFLRIGTQLCFEHFAPLERRDTTTIH